jgi:hypothetical protein
MMYLYVTWHSVFSFCFSGFKNCAFWELASDLVLVLWGFFFLVVFRWYTLRNYWKKWWSRRHLLPEISRWWPSSLSPSAKVSETGFEKREMVSTPVPVKMTCLCAPTKHAGSFRCRFHRSQTQWGGRPMPSSPPKTEDVEAVVSVVESRLSCLEPEVVLKPIVSLPAPPSKSLARSPPRGASRLNRMSIASQSAENEVLKPLANE